MYRTRAVGALFFDNLRRHHLFFLAGALGLALGVAVLVFFVGLGFGLKKHVAGRFFEALPETRLKITASGLDMGLFNLAKPKQLTGASLNDAFLLEARARGGVLKAFGETAIAFPIKVSGSFFGHDAASDLVATGLDPELVAAELKDPAQFAYREKGAIPVLVSRAMLDAYNTAFAPMNGFPQLKPESILGFRFDLILGQSYLGGNSSQGQARRVQCELVGFSTMAVPLGITLPAEYVRRFNQEFTGRADRYAAVFIDAKSPERIAGIKAWAENKGFSVQTAKEGASHEIGRLIDFVIGLFSALSGLIMIVAAINLMFLFFLMVQRRTREIALWRTLGASRLEIGSLIVLEAGSVGLIGGSLGLLAGLYGAQVFSEQALMSLRSLPLAPSALFDFPPWLNAAALAYATGFALLGSFAPALRAALLDPIRGLKS